MLDGKLLALVNSYPNTDDVMLVAQIKQVFADEGYRTGQEWHDRFKKEYRALSPNAYAKDRYAKMAAEKASGIT